MSKVYQIIGITIFILAVLAWVYSGIRFFIFDIWSYPYLNPSHLHPDCLEEYPAGALGLVPAERGQRAEGKENFFAACPPKPWRRWREKLFWF